MYEITPSEILDFTYCKRRWYLHRIENESNDKHILLVQGSIDHEDVDEFHKIIRGDVISITGMKVYNSDLNLYGVCDTVEIRLNECGCYIQKVNHNADIVSIERKHGKIRDCLEYKAELTAQVLCLEKMFDCDIEYSFIHYVESDEFVRVDINDELRNHVFKMIDDINSYYASPYIIKPKYSRKCKGCSMHDICSPRETNIDEYLKLLWGDLHD